MYLPIASLLVFLFYPLLTLLHLTPVPFSHFFPDLTCYQQFQDITGLRPDTWPPVCLAVAAVITAALGRSHFFQEKLSQLNRHIPEEQRGDKATFEECKPPGRLGCTATQGHVYPRSHDCSRMSSQPRLGVGG